MTKVVYNACYGGFGLSQEAMDRYTELSGVTDFYARDLRRSDPFLVQVVEELGEDANDGFSNLAIRDVPVGTYWRIDEYDGFERVMTMEEYDWELA
jgi:hypothetical protein